MSDINNQGFELDWDSEIEKDGQEYITLPEGVYPFTVMNFERARYNPSAKAKLPPCNMAVMSLQFKGAEGVATIKDKLYLHSSVEWRLCAFFTCIGQRKHGERISMNWNAVPGASGIAKLGIRTYTDDKGQERAINEVLEYLEPDESYVPPAPTAAAPTPVAASAAQTSYQAGKF